MPAFTKTVLSNLFSPPATRLYPAQQREPFPAYRGELVNDADKCILCGMCSRTCPSACLAVDKGGKEATQGSWRWEAYACVYCGFCVEACPVDSLSMKNTYLPVQDHRHEVELAVTKKVRKKAKAAVPPDGDKAPQA